MTHAAPRVVVVDDDPAVLAAMARLIRFALRDLGPVPVTLASTDEEALRAVGATAEKAALLVVSDFNLGCTRDGLELLQQIRQAVPAARLVLMSGYARDDLASRLEADAVDAFVPKPWSNGEFAALLLRLAAATRPPATEEAP